MGRIKNRAATSVCLPLAPLAPPPVTRPFALAVGPVLHHNGSMTTWSQNNLLVAGEAYVEICSLDAASIGVAAGDSLKITSDTGSVILKTRLSEQLQRGSLFVPAHFSDAAITTLTRSASFPEYVSLSKA
jgi:predicted molibdopterin-dependent oxidoreductase YjgC